MAKPAIYLLDASSYIHRAFHAIRGLSTSHGVPTGAVYGFVQMVLKVLRDARPEYVAVVFDSKGPLFRHEMYPQYKANRPPLDPALVSQFPLVRQVVTALSLPAVEMEGFEADDLMATLARKAVKAGFEVVLVSGDKDLYQLLSGAVTMWDTMKEKRLGPKEVVDKLGVGPEQIVDYMALTGDAADNVPGVPKVGPKTAAKLIQEHGGLDKVLAAAQDMKKSKLRENLINHADDATLSRDLVRLAKDAPLDFLPQAFKMQEPDPEVITPVLAQLEFNQLMKEFAPRPKIETDYAMVIDIKELEDFLKEASKKGLLAVDTETTSIDAMQAELVGVSLCHEPGKAIYLPVGHNLGLGFIQEQAEKKAVLKSLAPYLGGNGLLKIVQNLKYDLTVLKRAGVEFGGPCFDTMVASYVLNPGKASHGLNALAAEHLGRSLITYEEATGGKNRSFANAPLDKATQYAAEDADVALQLYHELSPRLEESGLRPLFADLEMPLVPLLVKIEMNGVGLDVDGLDLLSKELANRLQSIKERCYTLAGHEFNLNSTHQLGKVLFKELGLTQVKKTKKKTTYSTDVNVLTILAEEHPLPGEVLEYRTLTKLKNTYIDALPALVDPRTGRLHTSYNQAVTATGRLSSSNPNLQNIPIRTDLGERIRQCFVPGPGMVMISADYSQIELRVLAHLSGDPLLLDDLARGLDVHTQTASRLFDVEPGEVTGEMRRRAKTVNYGVLYGMSPFRLAREQKIDVKEAQDIIEKYLGRYAGIAAFQQANLAMAREKGYVATLLGRRRFLPAINSRDRVAWQAAERMALNTPIQGTAADLIKKAMLDVDAMMTREFPEALMILQVHDELVFECPGEKAQRFAARVKEVMESAVELKTLVLVDIGTGSNWAEAH